MLTDLGNDAAPQGSTLVTISVAAFKTWMSQCNFKGDGGNAHQEVYFLYKGAPFMDGQRQIIPNWHITAMSKQRSGGDCKNFHFKVEIGKSASYYWYYVVHRDNNGTYHWVGDPNPNIPTTNEAGGGAASDLQKLNQVKLDTETKAQQCGLDGRVDQVLQQAMLRKLESLLARNRLKFANNRID